MKVSRDEQNIYFHVRTREPITPAAGDNWMLLFLDTDCNHQTGWEGYDYLINRVRSTPGVCTIEHNAGGWKWETIATARYVVRGNEMELAVPRSAIGLEKWPLKFDFKWTDNVPSRAGMRMIFSTRAMPHRMDGLITGLRNNAGCAEYTCFRMRF